MTDTIKAAGRGAADMVAPGEARDFLEELWGLYVSPDAAYFEIFAINEDGKKIIKIFEGAVEAPRQVEDWLKRNLEKLTARRFHVYFGVLPRAVRPAKGRGKSSDVRVGKWLWLDLDYKRRYEKLGEVPIPPAAREEAKRQGYWFDEFADHALIGVYREKGAWIFVDRPPLSEVVKKVVATIGAAPAIVVDSGNGYHLYFRLAAELDAPKIARLESALVEALGGDPQSRDLARVLRLPGTVNPRTNRVVRVIHHDPDVEVDPGALEERLRKLEESKPARQEKPSGAPKVIKWRRLTEHEKQRIIDILKEAWSKAEGMRYAFVGSLAGLFAKSHIAQEDCEDIVSRLYDYIGRPDKEHVKDIKYTYQDYLAGQPVAAVESTGEIRGLKPIFEELLGVEKGQEALLKLLRIVSPRRPRGGLAWTEVVGDEIMSWVAYDEEGIHIYKKKPKGEIKKTRISSASIVNAYRVKIVGLENLRNLYKVELADGTQLIGLVGDIYRELREHYGMKGNMDNELGILLKSLSEEFGETKLYYSAGPWIVDGRIEIVEEPGYLPPWKPKIVWRLADTDEEKIKIGLRIVKQIVEAYKDPSLPSLVLSYGAVAWAAQWLKQRFSIFPNLILYGKQGRGKTFILELLKLIYNMPWSDYPPATDYQARRELTKSTLPYVLTEANDFFKKLATREPDRSALAGIAVLARAATDLELRESGGKTYGGTFLAIRAFIAATNTLPESTVALDPDKFIIVKFGPASGIELEKVRGITPRTLASNRLLRGAVAAIFPAILRKFEARLDEITKRLDGLSREELTNEYIRIGYEIWQELYEEHGLEPFPAPPKVSLQDQVEGFDELYREAFISYVERLIKKTTGDRSDEPPFEAPDPSLAIYALNYHMGVLHNGELIVKSGFLSQFSVWAERELHLPRLGVTMLAEILGFGKNPTTRTIGSERIKNVWAMTWLY